MLKPDTEIASARPSHGRIRLAVFALIAGALALWLTQNPVPSGAVSKGSFEDELGMAHVYELEGEHAYLKCIAAARSAGYVPDPSRTGTWLRRLGSEVRIDRGRFIEVGYFFSQRPGIYTDDSADAAVITVFKPDTLAGWFQSRKVTHRPGQL